MATAAGLIEAMCCHSAWIWAKKSEGIFAMRRPSRSFSCDSPMSTAMPLVKPMMIGTGT